MTCPLKSILQNLLLISMAAALIVGNSGCWSRRELETLGFVTAAGVDEAPEQGKVMLTVQVARPEAIVRTDMPTTQQKPFWLINSTGYTVFEAVRRFLTHTPRSLFWSHNRFVLFGEKLARQGIKDYLDYWVRDGETRQLVQVVVGKGTQASELLETEFVMEPLPSEGARGIILSGRRGLAVLTESTLKDFLIKLETEGVDPVAVRAEIFPVKTDEPNIIGELTHEKIQATARLTGGAIFKDDRLVEWLNQPEARGYNWVTGNVQSTILVVKHPTRSGKLVGVEVLRAKSKVDVQVNNAGRAGATVTIELEGNLGDSQAAIDPLEQLDVWHSLERRAAEVVRREVNAVVRKAQGVGADIFGFGARLSRTDPEVWKELRDSWEQRFSQMEVKVDVRVSLRRAGLTLRSTNVAR